MFPWDGVIPEQDVQSFRGRDQSPVRPIRAGTRPALIIVDMTWAFVDSRYPAGWSETGYPAVAANKRLLAAARDAGIPIFFTKQYPSPDFTPLPSARGRWKTGTLVDVDPALPPGDVIVDDLAPLAGETVIHKHQKPSGFFGTPLASLLVYEGVDTTIITGMTTSGCVRATVLDAFQYNFHVIIPYECVADRSQISHKVNLFDMHMKYADVASLDDTLTYLATVTGRVGATA
jgi:nicotinamidase-related amidase